MKPLPAILAASLLFAGCAPQTYNPGDPAEPDFYITQALRCALDPLCGSLPTAYPGMVLWLNAGQLSAASDGDSLALWSDSSGRGNHFEQAVVGNQPTFRTSVRNNHPAIRFVAANSQHLTAPEFMTFSNLTVFIVARTNLTGSNHRLFSDMGDTTNDHVYLRRTGTVQNAFGFGVQDPDAVMNLAEGNADLWGILSGKVLGTRITFALNGRSETTGHPGYSAPNGWQGTAGPPTVGGRANDPTVGSVDGDIAEVILYNRALAEIERMGVECYLSRKYVIAVPHSCS